MITMEGNIVSGKIFLLACVVALACCAVPAWAQLESEGSVRDEAIDNTKPRGVDGVEYGGVVTRAVISSLGELFYRRFAETWSNQKDTANYVLTVREVNNRKTGTEVLVVYIDDVLFKAQLPRNQQAVIGLSESAVESVYQKIVDISLNELLNDDPDMARAAF